MPSDTSPSVKAVAITLATATYAQSRGVYIGVSGDYDFSFDGSTWILFTGCVAGTVLPIQVFGGRHAADTAPDAGDLVFLY